jgi:hypothetical protein
VLKLLIKKKILWLLIEDLAIFFKRNVYKFVCTTSSHLLKFADLNLIGNLDYVRCMGQALYVKNKSEGTTLSQIDSNHLTKKLSDNCLSEIWSHEVQPQWNISSRSNHGILILLHVYNISMHCRSCGVLPLVLFC